MENKIELLKKLGFSDEHIKIISEDSQNSDIALPISSMFNFESINSSPAEITNTVIDKTAKPMNSYFIYNER